MFRISVISVFVVLPAAGLLDCGFGVFCSVSMYVGTGGKSLRGLSWKECKRLSL